MVCSDLAASVARHAEELKALALRIHATPESGFEEKRAAAWQVALLRKLGFQVRTPFAGLATAYKAVRGKGKPVFCFMGEYDALPEVGHACGHNLICTAAIGAGVALADALQRERRPGTVVVMGTPAEESRGGKVIMVARGALRGIDAAVLAHPSYRTVPDTGSSAIQRYDVTFRGKAAHAAAAPELGRNALDAVMLVFQAVNAWRQHLPEASRMHGIVNEGGVVPNIVPAQASCCFFLRSPDDAVLEQMRKRFRDIVKGAALMTGTTPRIAESELPYRARRANAALNEAYVEAAPAAGLKPEASKQPGRASSDFGDVSQVVPGVHVYFGIAHRTIAAHSTDFEKAAGSAYGVQQALRAAEALAVVGYRYMTEPEFRSRVRADFESRG